MQISQLISGLSSGTTLGKHGGGSTAEKTTAGVLEKLTGTSKSTNAKIAEIAKKYDVTDISPTEFSQMLQELRSSGALSEKDLQELSAVRADLESQGVNSEKSINLVEFYANRVESLQTQTQTTTDAAQKATLSSAKQRLEWMQKFASAHASDSVGLDLAA